MGVKTVKVLKRWFLGSGDDDLVDKLSHIYTVTALFIFTVVVSSGTYIKHGISCWRPVLLRSSDRQFMESMCWTGTLYYVPDDKKLSEKEHTTMIHYHLWIPIILLFQAFLFKVPNYFWVMMNKTSGLNVNKLVQLTNDLQMVSENERNEYIQQMASYIHKWIMVNRRLENVRQISKGKISIFHIFTINKHRGTYLSGIYLISKIWYTLNAICQYFLLSFLLKLNFTAFGSKLLQDSNSTKHYFPKDAYCNFQVRHQDINLTLKARCLLPINVLNEKIFIFLWFWFSFIAVLSCLSLLLWLYRLLARQSYINYFFRFLKSKGYGATRMDKIECKSFTDEYLKNDGILALRIVGKNSSYFVLSDLVEYLWNARTAENNHGNTSKF
ncbi:innexin unc-9 [Octopus sinensis]|uniref:Innexin n=1 Tax=Octopus sinensis TaxID=2607531 RepID=A0A6P7U263_9MOLL|nr:innexin unc-9 [Octopus sinensis]